MPLINSIKKLPYSSRELFDLVLDIDSYHEFLPYCISSRIISKDPLIAELTVAVSAFSESYSSSIVTNNLEGVLGIEVKALDGPFEYLDTIWRFQEDNDGTIVEFSLDFEFKSLLLGGLMNKLFSKAQSMMLDAFEKRAEYKYGANRHQI